MRIIATFCKLEPVKFVSHLDMQRLFQRAFRRAGLPLAYSQGFNPHPLLAFATALSVGYTSDSEYFDVTLSEPMPPEEFTERVNAVLPDGVRIIDAVDAGEFKASLTSLMRSAEYDVRFAFEKPVGREELEAAVKALMGGSIIVDKKTKGGIKPVDIRPMLIDMRLLSCADGRAEFTVIGKLTAEGGLPPELLFRALYEKLGVNAVSFVHRKSIEMDWSMLK